MGRGNRSLAMAALAGVLAFSSGAAAQTATPTENAAPTADNAIMLTIFLKHDQSRPLSELNAQLEKQGYYKAFPPAGIEVVGSGEVSVRRIVTAVDTGIVVNPDTVVAQLQGGLIFGLTAAFCGEITIDRGRIQQSNFHDYRMLRIDEGPAIEVHIIQSGEAPGGIGETGVTASLPAVRNAIFAATGIPLRRMPIDRDMLAGRKSV